jgi:hypothetical protein
MFSPDDIVQFLKSTQTQYLFLPLVIAFISGFVKTQSKPSSDQRLCRDDLAVGFDLTITAIFGFVTYAIYLVDLPPNISPQDQAVKLAAITPIVMVLVMFLWIVSVCVSHFGWVERREKLNWLGIGLPLGIAILAFREFASFIL